MSRAFVRESDDEAALPERTPSPHANYVTARGLAQIEARIRELSLECSRARTAADRAGLAAAGRDLRYFQQRRASARLVTPAADADTVRFGARVRLRATDGTELCLAIVGEDEADPGHGLLSYVSPQAQRLLGRHVGDPVALAAGTAHIFRIESSENPEVITRI